MNEWESEIGTQNGALWNADKVLHRTKLNKHLIRHSLLASYSYHISPLSSNNSSRDAKLCRFIRPATWPALESLRLNLIEKLFKSFSDWQKTLNIHVHPSVFELVWVLGHPSLVQKDTFEDNVIPSNGDPNVLSPTDERL